MTKSPSSNEAGDRDAAAGPPEPCEVWKVRLVPWASRDLAAKIRLTTVANADVTDVAADADDDANDDDIDDDTDDDADDDPGSFHNLRLAASSSKAYSSMSHARSQDRTYASSAEPKVCVTALKSSGQPEEEGVPSSTALCNVMHTSLLKHLLHVCGCCSSGGSALLHRRPRATRLRA